MSYRYVAVFAVVLSFAGMQNAFAQTNCCCDPDPTGAECFAQCVTFTGDCNLDCFQNSFGACATGYLAADPCAPPPDCRALPVELVSFSAVSEGLSVILHWETATETINAGYEIEQAIGSDIFEKIAFVEGAGTTTEPQSYSYTVDDLDPGLHVFRLKQVDLDGGFAYSELVEATVSIPGEFVLEPAYPNPFNPSTAVRFAVAREQIVRIALYDAAGRTVRSLFEGAVDSNSMQTVNVSGTGLATGVYIVRLEGESFVASQEIVFVK